MSNVINLAARRHQDTIGALRHMLERAEQGEIGGICFVMDDLATGKAVDGYTGTYRAEPGRLVQVLRRIIARVLGLQDDVDNVGT